VDERSQLTRFSCQSLPMEAEVYRRKPILPQIEAP
jgi:hypothetical protein